MESSGVDSTRLTSKSLKNSKVFLFKLPQELNFSILDGVSLNLNDSDTIVGKSNVNGVTLNLRRCHNSIDPNMRPLVCHNDSVEPIESHIKIGSIFDDQIIITEDFSGEMIPNEALITITRNDYIKKSQISGLRVRSLPSGSFTTVTELQDRERNQKISKYSSNRHSTKRQASIAFPAASTTSPNIRRKKSKKSED